MEYEDILRLVKAGKKLGLKSVKFLGAGEPFQDLKFLEFLRELEKLDIIPVIFTKGHVIGDDNEVKKWYSNYGITTGEELVDELKKVNASILLGFNSFDPAIQDKMVGNIKGYTVKRNRALRLLVEAGFNKYVPSSPTRLCLAALPLTKKNYDEMFNLYKWARVRNMATIVTPTMIAGRCSPQMHWSKITPSKNKLIDLYTKIYQWNIKRGIQTLEQLKRDGLSSWPCRQSAIFS
jgi:MoaA/NifB/PqqE/SkfB family radical SAM enzyme